MITIIAAMDKNNVIGKDGSIPWYIPGDMKRFKELTTGHTVVMGRKTYESLPPDYRPLPNRNNIVLTSQSDFPGRARHNGIEICQSTDDLVDIFHNKYDAFAEILNKNDPKIFIIGGASLYSFCIPFTDKLELTFVDGKYDGDTFFPPFFRIGDEITFDQHNTFTRTKFEYPKRQAKEVIYSFQTFERIR